MSDNKDLNAIEKNDKLNVNERIDEIEVNEELKEAKINIHKNSNDMNNNNIKSNVIKKDDNNTQNNKQTKNKKKKEKSFGTSIKDLCIRYSLPTYIVIGITLFFLSVMLAAQVKSISNTEQVLEGKREAQLAEDLVNLQKKYNDLKEKYEESEEIVNEYKTNASTNDILISSMKKELESLSLLSGTTDIVGEGIVITLSDGVKGIMTEGNSDTLVHDSDVLTVVNELKSAGAEAISVNGQRIISTSAIRCVGPVIQVNYQKVAAPFEIKAIGNAQYLESAMNIKNGIADTLRELGIGVTVSRYSKVKIPKYEGVLTFEHAIEDK